ncbi:MAG: helix-turn-helix domain-containing protein [Lachnospiraceae bacterium]|nr:helix-turn-helix domain-containing protein [Lachnospiraceae bacterium]
MDATKTGELIKESRIDKEMTQQALADALNVSATAVSKWENGHSLPDITMLEPLSSILGVSITDLVLGTRSNNNMENTLKETNSSDTAIKSVISEANRQKKKFKLKTILIATGTVVVLFLLWLFLFSWGVPARQKNVITDTRIEDHGNGPELVFYFSSANGKNLSFSSSYIMGTADDRIKECTVHLREIPISFNDSNASCSWGISTEFLDSSPEKDFTITIDYWGQDISYSLREEINKAK